MEINRGVTLIALVVTIVVMLIIAGISMSMLLDNNGILSQTINAKKQTEYENAKEKLEICVMNNIAKNINIDVGQLKEDIEVQNNKEQFPLKVKLDNKFFILTGDGNIYDIVNINEATLKDMFSKRENYAIEDEYGNIMIIPSGFRIVIDSTTSYQKNTINVTKGIVIEDSEENQFVWVPVGDVYTDKDGSDIQSIKLSRYLYGKLWKTYIDKDGNTIKIDAVSKEGTPIDMGDKEIEDRYLELESSSYGNTTDKEINLYKKSVLDNGGYYFGRYEARDGDTITPRNSKSPSSNKLVVNKNNYAYNYISQDNAFRLSSEMYHSTNFKSTLLNSYAWDTALLFVQTFDDRNETGKYFDVRGKYLSDNYNTKGNINDKICNIFDMCGNYLEWSTETNNQENLPCVLRGSNAGNQTNRNISKNGGA